MPISTTATLPKTKDAKEFESICKDVLEHLKNYKFELYGRTGQNQHGIDIVSKDSDCNRNYVVAQCKNYLTGNSASLSDAILEDLNKISTLPFSISELIFMTATDRDTVLQNLIREQIPKYSFKIEIMFWDDIERSILSSNVLLKTYYPSYAQPRKTPKYLTRVPNKPQLLLGRDSIITSLTSLLQTTERHILLNGLGGIGKTAIAQYLFHSLSDQYDYLGWIHYQDNLKDSILHCITLPEFNDIDANQRFDAIYEFLRNCNGRILLFLDDINKSIFDEYFEEMTAWDNVTLISTSRGIVLDGFHTEEIDFLSLDDCRRLFLKNYVKEDIEVSQTIIDELCDWASYHTLTIELLAKAARRIKNLSDFVDKLKSKGFDAAPLRVRAQNNLRENTITGHLQLLYNLANFKPEAEEYRILWNFALMPSIDIPYDVIEWISADVNTVEDLVQLGWLEYHYEENSYYMHALVKQIILMNLKDSKAPNGIFDEYCKYVCTAPYFTHKQIYSEKILRINILTEALTYVPLSSDYSWKDLYMIIAEAYFDIGSFNQSLEWISRAVSIAKSVLPENDSFFIETYSVQGTNYVRLELHDQALQAFSSALELAQTIYKEDNPERFIKIYSNLGSEHTALGNYDKASEYHQKALNLLTILPEDEQASFIGILVNASIFCETIGDYQQALEYTKTALRIIKAVFGIQSIEYARIQENYAAQLSKFGFFDKAINYSKRALKIKERVLGINHLEVAETYKILGFVYLQQSDNEQSLIYNQKALEIAQCVTGENSILVATVYDNMGNAYHNIGDSKKSLEYHQKALDILKKNVRPDHTKIAACYNNLATAYLDEKEYQKALEYYQSAYELSSSLFGAESGDAIMIENNIGTTYEYLKDYSKALQIHEKAIGLAKKVFGTSHPNTFSCYNDLGRTYYYTDNYKQALTNLLPAFYGFESLYGVQNGITFQTFDLIYECYTKLGKKPEEFIAWLHSQPII